MSEELNATCSICGKKYHVCLSCQQEKAFKPWRTVVDTIDHYKIYMAVHGYTVTKDKEMARKELSVCDLSELDSFSDNIKKAINEILSEDKTVTEAKTVKMKTPRRSKVTTVAEETNEKISE